MVNETLTNLFYCPLLIFALKCTLTVSWSVPALAQASLIKTIDSKCIFLHSESAEDLTFSKLTGSFFFFFSIKNVYLFLAGLGPRCCVHLPLSCREPGLFSRCGAGFSLQWLLLLWKEAPAHTGFSSCCTWAEQLCQAGLVAPRHVGSSWTRD